MEIFEWNDNNVCLNPKSVFVKTKLNSECCIKYAECNGQWFVGLQIQMAGGNYYGMGSGVCKDKNVFFKTELEAVELSWVALKKLVEKIHDHADAKNLIDCINKKIEVPELF